FALQVFAAVAGTTKLNPDAVEAMLFGNAGRTGTSRDMNLQGSSFSVGAFTTAGASYGISFGSDASRFGIGVTGKYIVGNALGIAEDQGSSTSASSVSVD